MAEILEVLEGRLRGRVAVVGVGDPAYGDDGAGPLVVAREPRTLASLRGMRVAIPGVRTTAYLLLRLA